MGEVIPAISCQGVSRRFDRTQAVDDVSFDLGAGECLCVIGPNGAGKTTLLMMLAGVVYPDRGTITLFGRDRFGYNFELRRESVVLLADPGFGACASPYEYWLFIAQVYGLPRAVFRERVEHVAEALHMVPHAHKTWEKLSLGMLKKTALVAAFLPDARLRIFDEPFAGGIDPAAMDTLYRWFGECNARGETIVFSTQVLEQAETAATRILLLRDGRIVAHDSPAGLIAGAGIDAEEKRPLYRAFMKLTGEKEPGE